MADENGLQALHFAAIGGWVDVLELLLQAMAAEGNITALPPLSVKGFTPLHYAVYAGHHSCIERLLKAVDSRHCLMVTLFGCIIFMCARTQSVYFFNSNK